MKQFIFGKVRVQVLNEDIIRLEYSKDGKFCDANTYFIPDKAQFLSTEPDCYATGSAVFVKNVVVYVPDNGTLAGTRIVKDGVNVYTYKKGKNDGELPPVGKTPEAFAIHDTPRIIVPDEGYTKGAKYEVEEGSQDVYVLLCNKDARKLRSLFVCLCGRTELVRFSTFGSWNSKYFAYSEESAKALIADYEAHGVPLDYMVIDTDWRARSDRGIGYDIDTNLFPDMKGFLSYAHSKGVSIMFNDHPEPVEGTSSVFDGEEIAYREEKLQSLLSIGLDTWWYDRNWHTALKTCSENVRCESLGLYLFQDVTKHYYQAKAKNKEIYRRPDIMGNVSNIHHGAYERITDTASHRFSVQWTGDIGSEYSDLTQEVADLVKATSNGITYVNSDCGGHLGDPDKSTFIRWMQYGCLSPVFRPHCTNTVIRTREPWNYDEETVDIVRNYVNMRYNLLPYIYKNAYENYCTGEPVFKGLGFEYPTDKRACACQDEYMIGNDILVAPVVGQLRGLVADNEYVEPVKAVYYNGVKWEGEPLCTTEYPRMNMVLSLQCPEEGVPMFDFSARFSTKLKFNRKVRLYITTDDGCTVRIDGKTVFVDETYHGARTTRLANLDADREYAIEIDYFQGGGDACCVLTCTDDICDELRKVYLPEGKWLDAFSGKVYTGGKTIVKVPALAETPVFVRLGAVLPLAYAPTNLKKYKLNKIVYDLYPCKTAQDSGYVYEDDGETTAYKLGEYRKSAYSSYYLQNSNSFMLNLMPSVGDYKSKAKVEERVATVRCHLTSECKNVKKVLVNGKEVPFKIKRRKQGAMPFNTGKAVPSTSVLLLSFKQDINKGYEVQICLG